MTTKRNLLVKLGIVALTGFFAFGAGVARAEIDDENAYAFHWGPCTGTCNSETTSSPPRNYANPAEASGSGDTPVDAEIECRHRMYASCAIRCRGGVFTRCNVTNTNWIYRGGGG